MGDAAIRAAQDKTHQAALAAQRANDRAAALAEAMRLAAEPRELAPTGSSDRPRRFRAKRATHVPDAALQLAFSEKMGNGQTWPRSLEDWRQYAKPNLSKSDKTDVNRFYRLRTWHTWFNEDKTRTAVRFQSPSTNNADTAHSSLVCAFIKEGVHCRNTGW